MARADFGFCFQACSASRASATCNTCMVGALLLSSGDIPSLFVVLGQLRHECIILGRVFNRRLLLDGRV